MNERIEGGERLVRRLRERGVDITAALWAKVPDRGHWYLYLVSPAVEGTDARPIYRQIRLALSDLDAEWSSGSERIDPFSVMLLAPSEPLARGVLERYNRLPDRFPVWCSESFVGAAFVEGAFIYPSTLFQPQPAG